MSIFKKIALLFIISFILMSIIGLWIDKINTKRIDNIVKEKYVSFLEHVLSSENDSQKLIKIFESNKFKIKRNLHISLNEILFHKKYSFVEVSIYKISFDDELFIKLKFENDEYFLKTPDEENLRDKIVLNILICIDEGDLYLHPKWQADFFYKLIKLFVSFLLAVPVGDEYHEVGNEVRERVDAVGDEALRLGDEADRNLRHGEHGVDADADPGALHRLGVAVVVTRQRGNWLI